MAQWTPYGFVPFQSNANLLMTPIPGLDPNGMLSPTMRGTNDDLRPHSVAFGASMYPFVNFQWQPPPIGSPQPPDLTTFGMGAQHPQSGLLLRPDVISDQPCYANDPKDQPTYANENQEEPSYLNTAADPRVHRGASLPPQLAPSDWTPKPPPRSKRNSRMGSRSSLARETGDLSVNPKELSDKLNALQKNHPTHEGPTAPKRPPRFKRDKRIRNMTLPREIKLQSIMEDQPSSQNQLQQESKPTVPQPGLDNQEAGNKSTLTGPSPTVPMPMGAAIATTSASADISEASTDIGIGVKSDGHAPIVPMPTTNDATNLVTVHHDVEKSVEAVVEATAEINEANLRPVVPQPNVDSNRLSVISTSADTSFVTATAVSHDRPNSSASSVAANFTVTLPMPMKRKSVQRDLDPLSSRSNSMLSIRDEIIDGLQKMSSSVDMLRRGVIRVYEDLNLPPMTSAVTSTTQTQIPTYAMATKRSKKSSSSSTRPASSLDAVSAKKIENPYETVSVDDGMVVIPKTVTELGNAEETNLYCLALDTTHQKIGSSRSA